MTEVVTKCSLADETFTIDDVIIMLLLHTACMVYVANNNIRF